MSNTKKINLFTAVVKNLKVLQFKHVIYSYKQKKKNGSLSENLKKKCRKKKTKALENKVNTCTATNFV